MKIISLNIEKNRHFDRIIPFLEDYFATGEDLVVCLQELYEEDLAMLKEKFNCDGVYFPMSHYVSEVDDSVQGIAILTRLEIQETNIHPYCEILDELPVWDNEKKIVNGAVIVSQIKGTYNTYTVGTVHFTLTPEGTVTQTQTAHLKTMLRELERYKDLILCGDFNAPRGRATFDTLATIYKDNIPLDVTTTIDGNIHRAGPLPYVVDGFFTTPGYTVTEIEIKDGLSDHKGIIAQISVTK